MEMNENIYKALSKDMTPFASANNIPKRLNMNVFKETVALQHIVTLLNQKYSH
jgi:hypothetical protein